MNLNSANKILILGGTGHLGSALTHFLFQELKIPSSKIRIFYLKNSPTNALADINDLDMFPGNILDSDSVLDAYQGVDYAFHMVGNTTFDPQSKKIQWLINVEGTRNSLNAALQSKTLKRFCYTSTVNILGAPSPFGSVGNEETSPYTSVPKYHSFTDSEEILKFVDDVHNNNIKNWQNKIGIGYFDSKLAAQELVNYYHKTHGLKVVSVLPGTMFGPYDYLIGNGMYILRIYNNKMPGVLGGGLPLAHVMDIVEGHIKAIENGKDGSKYIITGLEEDNRYQIDMVKIIAEVLREKSGKMNIKTPQIVFKRRIANIGGLFSELYSKLFHKPNTLSRQAVKAGTMASFYTYKKAENEFGYKPKRSFRQAIEEMYEYYKKNDMLNVIERFLDKK